MGVKEASNTLHLITTGSGDRGENTITLWDLHHVTKKLSSKDGTVAIVNCSWIAQKFGRILNDAVGLVIKISLVLKGLGYHIVLVVDFYQQNNAKKIGNERQIQHVEKKMSIPNTSEYSWIRYTDNWVILHYLWKKRLG